MKKRYIVLLFAVAVLLGISIGTTVAYLIGSSNRVENTFVVGNVSITLTETTGIQYKLIPGVTISKDPVVTVKANSESCWVFIKVQPSAEFRNFCTFAIAEGWTALPGQEGVYYRKAEKANADQRFQVIKDDSVYISDAVTEEQLSAITNTPKLQFTAYAVQIEGTSTAPEAWQIVNQ